MPDSFDLDAYFALQRLVNLHVSPDGGHLALTVQSVSADGKRFQGSVWEVSTSGDAPPRRLTHSYLGETARGYLPDGSILFTAARPDPDSPAPSPPGANAKEVDALHVLPADGGEPRRVLAPPAGIGEVVTARAAPTVVVTTWLHAGAGDLAADEARQQEREKAGVSARLVEHYPERYWDHDIGPRASHLLAVDLTATDESTEGPRDLVPSPPWPGWLEEMHYALSDDGSRLAFGASPHHGGRYKADLMVVDTAGSGAPRTLVDVQESHGALAWSPDGTTIAVASSDLGEPGEPMRFHLRLVDAATGAVRDLVPDWDGLPLEIVWSADGQALLVAAEVQGQVPVVRIGLDGDITQLTASGAYRNLVLAPDGVVLYAIRAHLTEPPVPVALDVTASSQEPRVIGGSLFAARTGTRLEEVTARAEDGTDIHSWLVLPERETATPMPLAVLIHGGPFNSWCGWSWRWNPNLLAAAGWAVLLPNPRLSTGYGRHHLESAWGDWASLPSGDILAAVDAATGRPDIDGDRSAALGGSYGGYMANWLAVTSGRFRAIVTHASVWNLLLERGASDLGSTLDHEFGDPVRDEQSWRRQSPHEHADQLRTPMLVIHGERDQRVSLANAQSLWTELQMRGVPSRMLLFPDENHWILKPQNSRLWYETVLAFLAEHVLDEPWRRPQLL